MAASSMAAEGWREVAEHEAGAELWCKSGDCLADRDSYGDCADCGEPLVWVVRSDG